MSDDPYSMPDPLLKQMSSLLADRAVPVESVLLHVLMAAKTDNPGCLVPAFRPVLEAISKHLDRALALPSLAAEDPDTPIHLISPSDKATPRYRELHYIVNDLLALRDG